MGGGGLPSSGDRFCLILLFSARCSSVFHTTLCLCPQVWRFSGTISLKREPESLAKRIGREGQPIAWLPGVFGGSPTVPETVIQPGTFLWPYASCLLYEVPCSVALSFSYGMQGKLWPLLVGAILCPQTEFPCFSQLSLFHLSVRSIEISCLLPSPVYVLFIVT